jgi:hypothetical protein
MPFKKYVNEPSCLTNRIDSQMAAGKPSLYSAYVNIASAAMSETVHMEESSWEVKEVDLGFSAATGRNFTISKLIGANIVQNRNDKFWFRLAGFGTRKCTIAPSFYTAATFVTAIKAALEEAFADSTYTFTVSIVAQKIRVTNSAAAAMSFILSMPRMPHPDSTAAANLGVTANSTPATTLNADTATDIGMQYDIITESANTSLSYVFSDKIPMDSDTALLVTTNTAAVSVGLRVAYGTP